MSNITISVITVVLNSEKTILRCLDSILNQSDSNFEHIIVDGLSTDNTLELIQEYKQKYDRANIPLKVISEKDDGIYSAMNKGVLLSSGNYVSFLNSDDEYLPDTIKTITNLISKYPGTIFYGLIKRFDGNKPVDIVGYHIEHVQKKMIAHPTMFIPKDKFEFLNGYSLVYNLAADYDLTVRLYQSGYNFYMIEQVLTHFYYGGLSTQRNTLINQEFNLIRYKNKFITRKELAIRNVYGWLSSFIRKIVGL